VTETLAKFDYLTSRTRELIIHTILEVSGSRIQNRVLRTSVFVLTKFFIVVFFFPLQIIVSGLVLLASVFRQRVKVGPPRNAEFLFYVFMPPQNCDAVVGDLEERYRLIHKKFGRRRANFWYWTQAVRSLGPIVWVWTKKISLKPFAAAVAWAIAKGLIGHDSRLAVLVELYRKIRS